MCSELSIIYYSFKIEVKYNKYNIIIEIIYLNALVHLLYILEHFLVQKILYKFYKRKDLKCNVENKT